MAFFARTCYLGESDSVFFQNPFNLFLVFYLNQDARIFAEQDFNKIRFRYLSRFTSKPPVVLAKFISSKAVNIPPAEISCPANTRPASINCWMVLKASRKYSLLVTVGTSSPILLRDWAKAEPPSLNVSNEKSM